MWRFFSCLSGGFFFHQADVDGISYFFVYGELRLANLKDVRGEALNKVYRLPGEYAHSHKFLKFARFRRMDIGYLAPLSIG